ncbi:DUF2142 domain-containing protein [Kamptonema formosum]|uniref:DUF2142 domain-containing protein n=1 Tax=Kamptonema formosum TaxID=331992 RepID=UPI000347D3FE|nr:DUF2142 domain-containing protein [Oscillatoria sp. PCC 10802]
MNNKFAFFWKSPETSLAVIAVIFGALFLLIAPPFQAEAEFQHFYRAFQISEGGFLAEKKVVDCYGHQFNPYLPSTTCVGGMLPQSILTTARKLKSNDIRYHPERKQKFQDILAVLNLPLSSDRRVFIRFPNAAIYSPISYFPQALGIATGRLFGFSPVLLIYIGRLFNLLFWTMLVCLAVKIAPLYKWLLFLLALSPMSLFQAASLSADAITNGLSFLLVALCLRAALRENQPVTKTDIIAISFLSLLLSLSKAGYFPLLFVFFLIPLKKFAGKTKYFLSFLSILLLSFAGTAAWSFLSRHIYVPLRTDAPNRLAYLLEQPANFLTALFNTFALYGFDYIEQFIGKLGWIDTKLPVWHVVSYAIILVAVALSSHQNDVAISRRQKAISATILLTNSFLIFTLFYITWTPAGADAIQGIQGRYFIPLAPLFFLLLYNQTFHFTIKNPQLAATCYSLFSSTLTAAVLWKRYYF